MLFECRHPQHDSVIVEMRHAPFHCLFHLRTSLVNELSNMPQNWLGEWRRPADVSIYSRISNSHARESRRDVVTGQSSSGGDPIEFFFSPEISVILRRKRNKTCSNFTMAAVCNDAPQRKFLRSYQSVSGLPETVRTAGSFFAISRLCCSTMSALPFHSTSAYHRSFRLWRSNLFDASDRWRRRPPSPTLLASKIV